MNVETEDRVVTDTGPPPPQVARTRSGVMGAVERFALAGVFVVLVGFFSVRLPDTFATAVNWQTIATSQSVLAVVALALIVPLATGRFDVSVGANLGFTAVLLAALMSDLGWPLLPAALVALAAGSMIGVVNGVMVAHLGVNSIIATLGTTTVLGGAVEAYTNGIPISAGLSTALTGLGTQRIAGIPVLFVATVVLAGVVWFVLTQTRWGRELTAIGSSLPAARLTGMDVRGRIAQSFVLSGVLAAVAGVLQLAAVGSADPTVGGVNFIVPALAAAFLGATAWQPGRYNVPGTFLGLFVVATAVSGLALLGVRPWVSQVFNGAVVIVAVVVTAQLRRRRLGDAEPGT
jgi:ribose transport system permease protein